MGINDIALECAKCADAFGKQIGALDAYVSEEKRNVVFTLVTNLSKVEFVYTLRNRVLCPRSTLFVRIYPIKTRPLSMHLYELMAKDDFRCTYFPYIESPQRMRACFAALSDILREYLPVVERLVMDQDAYDRAWADKQQAIMTTAKLKGESIPDDPQEQAAYWSYWGEFYEDFAQLIFFTNNNAYAAFLSGDAQKARKLYKKRADKGDLQEYEERLYAFLQTPAAEGYEAMPPSCAGILAGRDYANGKDEGKVLFITGSLCYFAALLVILLIAGAAYLFGGDTVYYPIDLVFLFILPLLPAAFGSVGLRRVVMRYWLKKQGERLLEQDAIANSRAINRVSMVLTVLSFALVLFFGCVFIFATPRFYCDRMVYDDAAKFPFLNPVSYSYKELERVYYIEGRYNEFDEFVDRGSYVLFFSEGRVIDLDTSITEEGAREHVLPLLEPYAGEVQTFASDRDLAQSLGTTVEKLFG